MGMLQNDVNEKTLTVHEISRIAKDKDPLIEMLRSQLAGKQHFTCINPLRVLFLF